MLRFKLILLLEIINLIIYSLIIRFDDFDFDFFYMREGSPGHPMIRL